MEKAISDGANNVNKEDISKLEQEIIEMSENYYENRAALKKKAKKSILLRFWYGMFYFYYLGRWFIRGFQFILLMQL